MAMKKMVWNIPMYTLYAEMSGAQKVKVGYFDLMTNKFETDCPVYEGEIGDLRFKKENKALWDDMCMQRVNHLSTENDVIVIGLDRYHG